MSRRNALSKQLAQSYTINGTEKTIDYADIDTLGNAPVMDFGITTTEFVHDKVHVVLDDIVKNSQEFANHAFMFAIVNETKKLIVLPFSAELVSTGEAFWFYPDGWTSDDQVHAIPLITNMKLGDNIPTGFGTMIIVRRPPRKND